MMGGAKAHYDCIKAFSETDFSEDLKNINVPTLVMHGDDDQIVPVANSAPLSAKLLKSSTLKIYAGLPHGMCTTHADLVNAELLSFHHGLAFFIHHFASSSTTRALPQMRGGGGDARILARVFNPQERSTCE